MKVRLLNVTGPTISLFMSAWLKADEAKAASLRNVVLFSFADCDEYGVSLNLEALHQYEQSCKAAFAGLQVEWISCLPNRSAPAYVSLFDPKAILRERAIRQTELLNIRVACKQSDVSLENVAEVWYAHGTFKQHLFHLCPGARGVRFEHGLADVKSAVSIDPGTPFRPRKLDRFPAFIKEPVRRLRAVLDEAIRRRLLWFSAQTIRTHEHVSLLGDEIRQANPAAEVKTIPASVILTVAEGVIRRDEGFRVFQGLEGATALVLLSYVLPYAKTEADHLHFFERFEDFLHLHYTTIFETGGVRNIVFKSRFFREHFAREGVQRFNRLRQRFQLVFLTDHSPSNLTSEYYLPVLRPRFLLGDYSSGLFYGKKLMHGVQTYAYDEWSVAYCRERYGQAPMDYDWLRRFFAEKHVAAFKSLLPKDTP